MIDKILAKLNAIPADKVLHFAVGVLIYAASVHVVGKVYALTLVLGINAAKEVRDLLASKNKVLAEAGWDIAAAVLGGLVALSISL